MSRLPASALEEGEQIHAILGPLLAEPGAAKRRAAALAAKPEARALAFGELDLVIETLLLRMRVDPRPTKQKTRDAPKPNTRDVIKPTTRDALPLARGVEPQVAPPLPVMPPPVPAAPQRSEADPPPVPPAVPRTTRNLERPTPVAVQSPGEGAPQRAPLVPPKRAAPPIYGADQASGPLVLARPGDAPETLLLYDDIVMLSAMNDRDGLLISLERLLVLARFEDHVRVFVDANENKLVGLYESQLKAFTKVPKRRAPAVDNTMPRVFLRGEKVALVLSLIDGSASINDIVALATSLHKIETMSVIAQLQRSGVIEI